MLFGWTRAVGLVAVAALLANAECYNACALATSRFAQTPSNGCHHQKAPSSHEDEPGCHYQHSEFTGAETGVAKVSVASAVPILAELMPGSVAVLIEPLLLSSPDRSPPPRSQVSSAISVLRI